MAELPGISRQLLGFADRLVALGCTAVLPDLFGTAGEDPLRAGPGVAVVGMCFSGGFALAMAVDPVVVAPVLAEPSLPLAIGPSRRRTIGCGDAELDIVSRRCAEGLQVVGLRFDGDPLVPADRFAFLRRRLGDRFVAVELRQQDGHPDEPLPRHHSVLTLGLIDEPGEPTRAALDRVLAFVRDQLGWPAIRLPGDGRHNLLGRRVYSQAIPSPSRSRARR